MIQKQHNELIKYNLTHILRRSEHIKYILKITLEYVIFCQQHYSIYCKKIFNNMIQFENKISQQSKYQSNKTNMILKLSKLYRQFPSHIENYSQINLIKLPKIQELLELNKYTDNLNIKYQQFNIQFKNYQKTIQQYNKINEKYSHYCTKLDQIIFKFKEYSDPIKFYDKSITSQYKQQLINSLNNSNNEQTKIKTQLQLLDSKRKFLDQLIKQIRSQFTSLFHNCLKYFQHIISQILNPQKGTMTFKIENQLKLDQKLKSEHSKHSQVYDFQLQRLSTFTSQIDDKNQIMNSFNQLLKDKNTKRLYEPILADHKLFHVRFDNLKNRKQITYLQALNLNRNLLNIFDLEIKKYKQFQKQFKQKQSKIFGSNSKDNYKKHFQIYFGLNTFQLNQFCLDIVQKPRKSFQKINKWMVDNYHKIKQIIESKKNQLSNFNKQYNVIMKQHLMQKLNYQNLNTENNNEITQTYLQNIVSSFDKFKQIFNILQASQISKDKQIAQKLIQLSSLITNQFNQCKIQNIIEKKFNVIQKIKNFKIINEALNLFKSDQIYNFLYQQVFSQNLQNKFESKLNQKQYQQALTILNQKQKITKKMLKKQIGCCGFVKAQPIQSQVLGIHKCYIYFQQNKAPYGTLKILKQGLIFQQSKWNICASKVFILIPNSDIHSVDCRTSYNLPSKSKGDGIAIQTQKGFLIFMPKQFDQLFQSLQKIYGQTYRKSMAIDKKNTAKNDSTQSGSKTIQKGASMMMINYNKQKKSIIEQPICFNPQFSKISNAENQFRMSGVFQSNRSSGTYIEQFKHKKLKAKSLIQNKQQKQIRKKLYQLQNQLEKNQFLPQQFIFISHKKYKSKQRKDYQFKDPQIYNKFLLKQLKKINYNQQSSGILLQVNYEWKVSYPNNVSLHSFKHGQIIIIDLNLNPPTISIIQWPHQKQQIFTRHIFFQKIKQMNNKIRNFVVNIVNKNFLFESLIQKQNNSVDDSNQILNQDIKIEGFSLPEVTQNRVINSNNIETKVNVPSIEQIHLKNLKRDNKEKNIPYLQSGQALVKSINI